LRICDFWSFKKVCLPTSVYFKVCFSFLDFLFSAYSLQRESSPSGTGVQSAESWSPAVVFTSWRCQYSLQRMISLKWKNKCTFPPRLKTIQRFFLAAQMKIIWFFLKIIHKHTQLKYKVPHLFIRHPFCHVSRLISLLIMFSRSH
jgi:hypothetical protein